MPALGHHVLADFYDCDQCILNDPDAIRAAMVRAAEEGGVTVIDARAHAFSPHGVTGMVILAESHLAVHTWPEYRFAAVDIFTCGADIDPTMIVRNLEISLGAGRKSLFEVARGEMRTGGARLQSAPGDSGTVRTL